MDTDSPFKKKHDTIALTIPGLPSTIDIPFVDGKLAVCGVCKNNSKTREFCRERLCHTDRPWSTVFICITLDTSCFNENNLNLDLDFKAETDNLRSDLAFISDVNPDIPICLSCKQKNYTRPYCREKLKHRTLPYVTNYVTLKGVMNPLDETADVLETLNVINTTLSDVGLERHETTNCNTDIELDDVRFLETVEPLLELPSQDQVKDISDESNIITWNCSEEMDFDNKGASETVQSTIELPKRNRVEDTGIEPNVTRKRKTRKDVDDEGVSGTVQFQEEDNVDVEMNMKTAGVRFFQQINQSRSFICAVSTENSSFEVSLSVCL